MKFISFAMDDRQSWGVLDGDAVYDLGRKTGIPTLAHYLAEADLHQAGALIDGSVPDARRGEVTLLPVVPTPEKIFCVVRNYTEHHKEMVDAGMNLTLDDYPPIFLRVWRSLTAHNAPIVIPHVSDTLDWEGELAVIIGKGGRHIPPTQAMDHVAGYACFNDASVREWQFHAKQIASGKNFESTGGFGPWLVPAHEVDLAKGLHLTTRVNGEVVQTASTLQMIFSIPTLISYLSTIVTLTPGDVIATGTPSGVGVSRKPPQYLKAGDRCEVEIEHVGILMNPIAADTILTPVATTASLDAG